jgi:hypothetical protein
MSLLKSIALTLILIVSLSSLIIVETVYTQSIPKLYVPKFPATLALTVLVVIALAVSDVYRVKRPKFSALIMRVKKRGNSCEKQNVTLDARTVVI